MDETTKQTDSPRVAGTLAEFDGILLKEQEILDTRREMAGEPSSGTKAGIWSTCLVTIPVSGETACIFGIRFCSAKVTDSRRVFGGSGRV